MEVISARNVEEALILGMKKTKAEGKHRDSRNGPVYTFEAPLTTVYQNPRERVMFLPERDCNPFFHFMESLWMLAGRNDVAWIERFNSTFGQFSDDGVTFHGAYGYRWRNWFGAWEADGGQIQKVGIIDQLQTIAAALKQNPDDRRIVLQMWDTSADLGMMGKDFPCNLVTTFRINPSGHLDMTVFNRSNDLIWGAYGANAVHFSVLQEVMAAWIGVPVGRYWQISSNFHAYLNTFEKHKALLDLSPGFTPYELGEVQPFQIVNTDIETWFRDLDMFMSEGPVMGFQDPFFKKVVVPMFQAWEAWKDKDAPDFMDSARYFADRIAATDWRKACLEWLERRDV